MNGPFNNILASFGWTAVHTWQVLHAHIKSSTQPQYAVVSKELVHPTEDLTSFAQKQKEAFAEYMRFPGMTCCAAAYDPALWQRCSFFMTTDVEEAKALAQGTPLYEVHHISRPA